MFDFSELKDGTVHEKMYLMFRNKKYFVPDSL